MLDQQKDSGIDEDSQDKCVELNVRDSNNVRNVTEKNYISPQFKKTSMAVENIAENCTNLSVEAYNNILRENHIIKVEESLKDSFQLSQSNDEDVKMNGEDEAQTEESCDTQKKHLQPKVMFTEILNKRYKIVNEERISNASECPLTNVTMSTSCLNVIDNDMDSLQERITEDITMRQEENIPTWLKVCESLTFKLIKWIHTRVDFLVNLSNIHQVQAVRINFSDLLYEPPSLNIDYIYIYIGNIYI